MDSILSKYYYVPKLGFTSAGQLCKRLKGDGYNIPLLTVKIGLKRKVYINNMNM